MAGAAEPILEANPVRTDQSVALKQQFRMASVTTERILKPHGTASHGGRCHNAGVKPGETSDSLHGHAQEWRRRRRLRVYRERPRKRGPRASAQAAPRLL